MEDNFKQLCHGHKLFRDKYALQDSQIMKQLSEHGQHPDLMVVACSDSRVDPSILLQCDPGDLFMVRNVANIVPPFEKDNAAHATSAALEYGVRVLKVKHLVIMGHSQCGGVQALLNKDKQSEPTDFIAKWVTTLKKSPGLADDTESLAKLALQESLDNCMSFPWIKTAVMDKALEVHLWYFDIESGQISAYSKTTKNYEPL